MGVEINPFKAPSLTLYITPSSRVSSGPPDVAMCQSPVPSLSSFLLFFPFLSPNHMPWYSLITISMLLFFLGGVGGVSLYRLSNDFFPSQMYVHGFRDVLQFYFLRLFLILSSELVLRPFPTPFPYLIFHCPVTTIW